MGRPSKYPQELRERAVRMVFEHAHEHPSQWATIRSVASKLDCTTECLRRWVRQAERDTGQRPGLTTTERERLKELGSQIRADSSPIKGRIVPQTLSALGQTCPTFRHPRFRRLAIPVLRQFSR